MDKFYNGIYKDNVVVTMTVSQKKISVLKYDNTSVKEIRTVLSEEKKKIVLEMKDASAPRFLFSSMALPV